MPTDESLPRFLIRPSNDNDPYHQTILHSSIHHPAEPAYMKTRSKHPDEYSIALLDAYIPDICFGQVLAKPTIATPSLSLEEIRRQNAGGQPNLPIITLPTEFTVQLYNPESQVVVRHKQSKWTGSFWEFTLPKKSFRQPTGSRLDAEVAKTSSLPLSGVSTFRWRKDGGVMSKTSLKCTMLSEASTSNDPGARRKGGAEPDIVVAIMDKLKDVTIYEPNLMRVDVEDRKGLELVLVLTATVIADIYFTPPSTSFNVGIQSAVATNSGANERPGRTLPAGIPSGAHNGGPSMSVSPTKGKSPALVKVPSPPNHAQTVVSSSVLQETARLQRQQQKDAQKKSQEEQRRAKQVAQDEERARQILRQEAQLREQDMQRRKRAEEAEFERLKRQYSRETIAWQKNEQQKQHRPAYPPRPTQHQARPSASAPPSSFHTPQRPTAPSRPLSQQLPPRQTLYSVPEGQRPRPSGQFLAVPTAQPPQQAKRKSSFLGLFGSSSSSGGSGGEIRKKKSSFW